MACTPQPPPNRHTYTKNKGFEVLAQLAGQGPYEFGSEAARARPYR
jgi:hypothetical protein